MRTRVSNTPSTSPPTRGTAGALRGLEVRAVASTRSTTIAATSQHVATRSVLPRMALWAPEDGWGSQPPPAPRSTQQSMHLDRAGLVGLKTLEELDLTHRVALDTKLARTALRAMASDALSRATLPCALHEAPESEQTTMTSSGRGPCCWLWRAEPGNGGGARTP